MKKVIAGVIGIFGGVFCSLGQQQLPVDQPVPDVTAYTEDGKAFPFKEKMKGHYSVVVFGCMT